MKLIFIQIFFFLSVVASAQKDETYYLDDYFSEVSQGQHSYYQVIQNAGSQEIPHYQTTYYLSGSVYSKGLFSKENFPSGFWEFYYPNGKLKEKIFYDRVPSGYYVRYYESGNMHFEGTVVKTSKKLFPENLRISNFWNSENVQLVREGQGRLSIIDDHVEMEGKIKDGLKDSIWYGSSRKHSLDFAEIYREGEFVSGISIDSTETTHRYKAIEEHAGPRGGFSAFYDFVRSKITLPKKLKSDTKVVVSFVIGQNGKLTESKIVSSNNTELEGSLLTLVNSYPPGWTAKTYRGLTIPATFTIPFRAGSNYEFNVQRDFTDPSRRGQVIPNPPLSGIRDYRGNY